MLTLVFVILLFMVFGKLLIFALKAAWGISKILCTVVLLPLILVGLVIIGLVKIVLPVLLVIGIISLLLPKLNMN
ncbi:MAG: hypothetical protein PHC41_11240 [Lachnospiraceae bacterium]|jgi:hypothetical protein|nr:hypothetical protein [Lachnospiraceae bacterium]MDD3616781.1 hypothetical protein [Lachnospiraceae bacterium]